MNENSQEKQLWRQQPLTSMRVTIFRVENELGLLPLPRHGESAFGLPLRHLDCREILSTSEELAAAMVYRQAVSIHRHKRLKALRAPKIIIENEVKLHAILERLQRIDTLNGTPNVAEVVRKHFCHAVATRAILARPQREKP